MFFGRYDYTIDAKGRLNFPAKFRDAMGESFVVLEWVDSCLFALPMEEVERLVKNKFRRWSTACTCPPEFPVCVCGGKAKAKLITRKPIEADTQELEENRRSRSAHLRVLEKC